MIQRCYHTMRRTFLLGVLVLVTLSIGAQGMLNRQYNIHFLDLTSGLPQNFVNQIFVDSYGFIWISTYGGGAVRYDGYSFVSPVLSGRNGVYSHSCKGFAEDGHQRLWIAFDECAAVLDMHTMQRVIPQTAHGDISRLLKKPSFKIYCDSKGCIWQVTNDSIFHYTFDREGCVTQIASCHYQGNTPEISIHDIERNGTVWCCIDGGLYRLTKSGNQLTKKEISPSMAPLRGLFVTDMLKRDNTVWISTNQGLFAYDLYTSELRHFMHTAEPQSLSHNHATALAIAPDGRLLVGTLRGLDIMNNDNGTFEHWNSTSDERPLPSDFVHCLLTINGQVWIGTETAGIVKLVPRSLMMRNYVHHPSRPESLSPHPVNAMCIDQHGTLWAGTVEGGLNRKNGTDSFDHWTTQNSALSHNSVSVLEPDDQGRLWIGTWGGGLNMITTDDSPVLRHIDMAPEFVALTNYVGALAYDKSNEALWIGSKRGSASYDIGGNMWAPDVIYNKKMGKYCMYLSVNGDHWYSSIIMLTADKIEGPYRYQAPVVMSGFRSQSSYTATDAPIVLGETMPARYAPSDNYGRHWPNAIDPCVFYDETGKLWMSYGSWSGGIFMLELDEETGLRNYDVTYEVSASSDPYFGKKISGGYYSSGEASYIEYIGGYYFLFVTNGGLEAAGGYQMRVFRSLNPDGPYVDSKGSTALLDKYYLNFGPTEDDGNRGVNILGAYSDWGALLTGGVNEASGERAQGHNSIIAAPDGRTYLVYHTRFQNWGEGHQVRVHQVYQNEEGWLVAAPFEYTGEGIRSSGIAAAQKVPTNEIAGHYKLLTHTYGLNHASKEYAAPIDVDLNANGTVIDSQTENQIGTWTAKAGTAYVTITLGTSAYKGVMVPQTLEPTDTKVPCFTALDSATGVTIWGYKAPVSE